VGIGVALDPALDLTEVGRQVVGQVDLRGLAGREEHVVQGGSDAEDIVRFEVGPEAGTPEDIGAGEEDEQEPVVEAAQDVRCDE
jgi:hypothetical protein